MDYYVIMVGKSPSYAYGPMTLEQAIVEKENRIAVHGKMGYTVIIVIEPRDLVITGGTT